MACVLVSNFFAVKLSLSFMHLPQLGRTNMGFGAWTKIFFFPQWKIARNQWVSSVCLGWFVIVHLQQKYSCTDWWAGLVCCWSSSDGYFHLTNSALSFAVSSSTEMQLGASPFHFHSFLLFLTLHLNPDTRLSFALCTWPVSLHSPSSESLPPTSFHIMLWL